MVVPERTYQGYLPLFPDIYLLEIRFPRSGWESIDWASPVPRPRQQNETKVDVLEYPLAQAGGRAVLRCEYRLHAFNQRQRRRPTDSSSNCSPSAWGWSRSCRSSGLGYWSMQRKQKRELRQALAKRQAERAGAVALRGSFTSPPGGHKRGKLGRKLLEQQLDAAKLESRAAEAEKPPWRLKSQLYASIGIMAGSYAHNIKNLLVRPNDLLARCIEADGITPRAARRCCSEVKRTLGTVTERLQQILRTVRRDPSQRRDDAARPERRCPRDPAATWARWPATSGSSRS